MSHQSHLLTDDQMRRFIVNGYLTVKANLPDSVHETIYQTTRQIFEKEGNPGNNLLPRVPLIQRVFDCPTVRGALTSVLGPGYYMQPHRHAHITTPGSAMQKMHLDTGNVTRRDYGRRLWRPHRPRTILVFYYPQDTPLAVGPTAVVKKSCYYPRRIDGDAKYELPLCAAAGAVTIAHYDLWHRGMANHSDKIRFMIKFLFSRMAEPDGPAWACEQSAWQTQDDDAALDRNRIWSHLWNWLAGRSEPTSTGPADHKRIAELIKKLDDASDAVGVGAAYALGEIGAPAVAPLIEEMGSKSETVRRNTCFALSRVGTPAVAALAEIAGNVQWPVRGAALDVLAEIGPAAQAALPQIIELIRDDDAEIRSRAVEALGIVGQADTNVAPVLGRCLADEDEFVRRHGALALGRLASGAAAAVSGLVQSLQDENRYVVANALEALKRICTPEAMHAMLAHLQTARWCAATTTESLY